MNKALTELAWGAFAVVLALAVYATVEKTMPGFADSLVKKVTDLLAVKSN